MTSSGMSSHGSNGRGSTVSITGHLIVVDTSDSGAAVDRSSTLPLAAGPVGLVCQTTITAATSAHSADRTRSLATTYIPCLFWRLSRRTLVRPSRECSRSATAARTGNKNMF